MKKLVLILTGVILCAASAVAKDEILILEPRHLPPLTLSILSTYFPDTQVVKAQKRDSKVKNSFEVWLDNGVHMEFNNNGEWKLVECLAPTATVPEKMINGRIRKYFMQFYPNAQVSKMLMDKKGNYEIHLTEGKVLYFDNQFKFKKVL